MHSGAGRSAEIVEIAGYLFGLGWVLLLLFFAVSRRRSSRPNGTRYRWHWMGGDIWYEWPEGGDSKSQLRRSLVFMIIVLLAGAGVIAWLLWRYYGTP